MHLSLQFHYGGFLSLCRNRSAWTSLHCILQITEALWTCVKLYVCVLKPAFRCLLYFCSLFIYNMMILWIDILHFNVDVRFFRRVLLILLTLFVLTALAILPRLIGYLFSAQSFLWHPISNNDIIGMLCFTCDVCVCGSFWCVSKMLRMGTTILFGWKAFGYEGCMGLLSIAFNMLCSLVFVKIY